MFILPRWSFSKSDTRVPHRSHTLAFYKKDKIQFFVNSNHKKTLFWVYAIGPGFAGDCSRYSRTLTTKNKDKAQIWIDAVKSGNVGIEE